ncbi:hypothetical protein C2S53_015961 [Perilla frutescens var. hirtella]|uniref:Uncharacterized protein n=1 Tax=Perilla frutescens var. hirtella TaxID=608512 RepID=A0AAD4P637_PERFH|nr:hypothetical protein C2S53_015961 [Perilla frutescens var. hirtella]
MERSCGEEHDISHHFHLPLVNCKFCGYEGHNRVGCKKRKESEKVQQSEKQPQQEPRRDDQEQVDCMFCIDVRHTSDECNLKKIFEDEEAGYDKHATSDVQLDVITQPELASQPNVITQPEISTTTIEFANKKASMSFHARNLVGAPVTPNDGDLLKIFTQGGKNFVHFSGLQAAASKKRKSGKEVAAINKENE